MMDFSALVQSLQVCGQIQIQAVDPFAGRAPGLVSELQGPAGRFQDLAVSSGLASVSDAVAGQAERPLLSQGPVESGPGYGGLTD